MTFDPRWRSINFWKRYGRPDVPVVGTAVVPPSAPTGLTSTSVTDTSITLSWTLSASSGVTEQRVYLNNSRYLPATVNNGTSNSVTITGLVAGRSYTWKITAFNATTGLNSAFSTSYTVSTSAAVITKAAPSDVSASVSITADGSLGFTSSASDVVGAGTFSLDAGTTAAVTGATALNATGSRAASGVLGKRVAANTRTGTGTITTAGNVGGTGTPGTGLLLGHKPGRFYFGWSTSHSDSAADAQLNTLAPGANASDSNLLGVRRLYSKDQTVIDYIDARNRVLWISAKVADLGASSWANIASGASPNSGIDNYFSSLVNRDKLTIFTFHHEPIGDDPNNGATFCAAFLRIMKRVDTVYPGHKIVFCPNYEENRLLRNLNGGAYSWATWCPPGMMPGLGGERPWDFISFDIYQYGADTTTTPTKTHAVQFSNRWPTVEAFFSGDFVPNGTTPASVAHLRYTIGKDLVLGIGEGSARPGSFYYWQTGTGTAAQRSNMTGAKYARDYLNWVFNNPTHFYAVSWFNSIGADILYNDERLYPNAATWGGKTQTVNLTQQTGDTELSINVYREKLRSPYPLKLAANGLPA